MKRYVIDAGFLSLHFIGDGRVKPYFDEAARMREESDAANNGQRTGKS